MSEVESLLRSGQIEQLGDWLDDVFPSFSMRDYSLAIWRDGEVAYWPNIEGKADSPFSLGCLQDAIIGALFCALVDEGRLAFDTPLSELLPELRIPQTEAGQPRLEHLLSHSTGLWIDRPRPSHTIPPDRLEFCRSLAPAVPRFTPGAVVIHSLLDRILLLQIADRLLSQPVYAEIRERFAEHSSNFAIGEPEGQLQGVYSDLLGDLSDGVSFITAASRDSWFEKLAGPSSAMRPIIQSASVGPWAPVADGLGLFRQGNGIFGQDGDHPKQGCVGVRLSPARRLAVMGHFRSPYERDSVLNRLACDLIGLALPSKSPVLGDLNGFAPEDLTGTFFGVWGQRLYVEWAEGQIRLAGSLKTGALPAHIQSDGSLTGRWAAPNLWIEPQSLDRDDLIGFRFGKHLYVRDRLDQRMLPDE